MIRIMTRSGTLEQGTSLSVPKWTRFERTFTSSRAYENALQDAELRVTLTAPSGRQRTIDGFWDGGTTWRVRFAPDEAGTWTYATQCSDEENAGLHGQHGQLTAGEPGGDTAFRRHGPLRVADDRRSLEHAGGTPFLWIADTCWAGPVRSSAEEWEWYLQERQRQRFTAVQWVTTQFIGAPDGDPEGRLAYRGVERITLDVPFFQRLDKRLDAMNRAGLLGVTVLLWAAAWGAPGENSANPGHALPEDQLILLARYMIARWGANDVVWILNGDGNYTGEVAARWRRVGRALFEETGPHLPVLLHPCGMNWPYDEFRDESWLDLLGYQSGHGDDDATWRWLVQGPPATDWQTPPPRPVINLEPPYEYHIAYQSKQRLSADTVRRALYWSMLVSPTAGVTYGGHGVWGWDDGSGPPAGHPSTGTPLPWREAVRMAGAEQVAHLAELFTPIKWWRLRPAQEILAEQPGAAEPQRWVAAARSEDGGLTVVYVPAGSHITLRDGSIDTAAGWRWFDPVLGGYTPAAPRIEGGAIHFDSPSDGDWVLVCLN
jgi:hypothetical protein